MGRRYAEGDHEIVNRKGIVDSFAPLLSALKPVSPVPRQEAMAQILYRLLKIAHYADIALLNHVTVAAVLCSNLTKASIHPKSSIQITIRSYISAPSCATGSPLLVTHANLNNTHACCPPCSGFTTSTY